MKRKNRVLNKDLMLVPKSEIFDLVSTEDFITQASISILMTKNLDYMHKFGMKEDPSKQGYCVRTNRGFRIILGREFKPCLYRGQNKDYGNFMPSYCRNFDDHINKNEVLKCIAYIKKEEFKKVFKQTPYYKVLTQLQIMDYNFEFDLEALAQHYDFKTYYTDVTKDINVALFFAYTDCKDGKYFPVTDFKTYEPTLYISNFVPLLTINNVLKTVGFQSALRPLRQSAMALDLSNSNDPYSHFRKITLKPSEKIAKRIFDKYNQGKDLFPDEPINEIKELIINKKELSKSLFYNYCNSNKYSSENLKKDILAKGYLLEDSKLELNQDLYSKIEKEIYETIIPWIKQNITYRNIKRHKTNTDKIYVDIFPKALN